MGALAQLVPSFNNPVLLAMGVLCTWLLVLFPFAIWAMKIVRPDALNRLEAYALGQTCGPVGVYLVHRANRAAAARAFRQGLLVDQLKQPEAGVPGPSIDEVRKQNKELGLPAVSEMPGGKAFRGPPRPGLIPAHPQAPLPTVGLTEPLRPAPPPKLERAPLEPPPPPPTKAQDAWRPPPSDYKFTHSDEGGGDKPAP